MTHHDQQECLAEQQTCKERPEKCAGVYIRIAHLPRGRFKVCRIMRMRITPTHLLFTVARILVHVQWISGCLSKSICACAVHTVLQLYYAGLLLGGFALEGCVAQNST